MIDTERNLPALLRAVHRHGQASLVREEPCSKCENGVVQTSIPGNVGKRVCQTCKGGKLKFFTGTFDSGPASILADTLMERDYQKEDFDYFLHLVLADPDEDRWRLLMAEVV